MSSVLDGFGLGNLLELEPELSQESTKKEISKHELWNQAKAIGKDIF